MVKMMKVTYLSTWVLVGAFDIVSLLAKVTNLILKCKHNYAFTGVVLGSFCFVS